VASTDVTVRVAAAHDVAALASLRSLWDPGDDDPELERRIGDWLAAEGARRTTWLALLDDTPVGMASLFEYRRMPRAARRDSRWGYVGNVCVREEFRNRGIGSALLEAIIAAADERDYAHLMLAPQARALPFFRRAGFVGADDRLLVRPGRD